VESTTKMISAEEMAVREVSSGGYAFAAPLSIGGAAKP
jgi:hypothetical protein